MTYLMYQVLVGTFLFFVWLNMSSYLKSILRHKNYQDIHDLFYCTNNPPKELTESYSAYNNLKYIFDKYNESMDEHLFIHIGDGSTCRTAAMFSFFSKSFNISIDPVINIERVENWIKTHNVERLEYFKTKVEELNLQLPLRDLSNGYTITFVHSHAKILSVVNQYPNWKYIFTMPCCNFKDQTFDINYMKTHEIEVLLSGVDKKISSEKNLIFIYKNKKMENQNTDGK